MGRKKLSLGRVYLPTRHDPSSYHMGSEGSYQVLVTGKYSRYGCVLDTIYFVSILGSNADPPVSILFSMGQRLHVTVR